MSHVVVVADPIATGGLDLLRETPDFEVISTVGEPGKFTDAISRAHALVVRSATKVTEDILSRSPGLRVIARAGIGVDNIDVEAATRRGVAVLNAPSANTVSAAEHTIALLLALQRRVPWAVESMRKGEWDRRRFSGSELRGKTLGAVGLGRIGQHIAMIARAFGMHVVAHDPFLAEEKAREIHVRLVDLEEVLREADVVTLHIPLTKETKGIIDRERLALMKPTSVIINTARGGLIDTVALIDALDSGKIAGAALDVFVEEPLPADSPLRSADKLILTPHLAASTAEAQERVSLEICRSVRDALLTGDIGGAVNVPGISSEALARFRPALDLARRLGRLAAGIAVGRVRSVEVYYGGEEDGAPKVVMLAAVEGVLTALGVSPVSLVNAQVLAAERTISVARRVGPPAPGFQSTVGVELKTAERRTRVMGALVGEHGSRITRIDGFNVDVPPTGHVLVLRNRDVPGVIGRVGTVLGDAGINIASYHLARRDEPGSDALAAIVVDQTPHRTVLDRLATVSDVLDVRFADLDGAA